MLPGFDFFYDERWVRSLSSNNKYQGSNSHNKMTDTEGKRALAKKRQKRDKKRKTLKKNK